MLQEMHVSRRKSKYQSGQIWYTLNTITEQGETHKILQENILWLKSVHFTNITWSILYETLSKQNKPRTSEQTP
jgi:hypothetical protein